MTVLSPAELAAIKARAEAATPGPVAVYDVNDGDHIAPLWAVANAAFWAEESDEDAFNVVVYCGVKEDAEFIAAAQTDVRALLAHADALEEQGSRLTREIDLKLDEIERQAEELTVLERNLRRAQKVADDRGEEIQQLRAKLAALEAKPTSGPPHLDPRKHDRGPGWGHTQMLDAEHLDDPLPSLGSVHAACTPEGCPTVAGRTPYAEAGIAAEDTSPDAIDAELNGHEPTSFVDGGAL